MTLKFSIKFTLIFLAYLEAYEKKKLTAELDRLKLEKKQKEGKDVQLQF